MEPKKQTYAKQLADTVMQNELALNQCPFCGSEYVSLVVDEYGDHFAQCLDCGAQGPYKATADKALESWNNRFS